jgi:hypothetical protein
MLRGNDRLMTATKFPYGKPVKLLIDLQGFPDGRLVVFDIWKEKGSDKTLVKTVNGVIKNGKGVGEWTPGFKKAGWIPLEKTVSKQAQSEKYHFIAKIDDQEAKSGDFAFTHPILIHLEDENGNSLSGVEYTITFADGTKKQGVFTDGHVNFGDAPPGKFKLELKNYKFVF